MWTQADHIREQTRIGDPSEAVRLVEQVSGAG